MTNTATATSPSFPVIEAADLKAVRDFLTAFRDEQPQTPSLTRRPQPFARHGERKAPTVSNGITRARLRSAPKSND